MNYVYIILSMIFLHILDDFCLQGILSSMKQEVWWIRQDGYNRMYKNDYIISLIIHSFSWSFMFMLPLMILGMNEYIYLVLFIVNVLLHAIVDHMKCNKLRINLIQDQLFHLFQIIVTFIVFILTK